MKVELSATLALSLYVLQQVVSSMLPTNDKLPYCQTALNASLILSGVSLATSIASYTSKKAKVRLPDRFANLLIHKLGRLCLIHKYRNAMQHKAEAEALEAELANRNCLDEKQTHGGELAEICRLLHEMAARKRRKHAKSEYKSMHKAVWNRIDITFNCIVLVFYLCAVIYYTTSYLAPRRHP